MASYKDSTSTKRQLKNKENYDKNKARTLKIWLIIRVSFPMYVKRNPDNKPYFQEHKPKNLI
jgi:hypothetical protein